MGDGAGVAYPPNERGSSFAHFSISPFALLKQIPQFVFSGAFERFPKLQVSVAECRIGWLPFLITWMDRQVEVRPPDPTAPLSMLPSEYVKRNMTFTFEEDYIGAHMLAHDWADWEATKKSYELFARYVLPKFNARNAWREDSMAWLRANREENSAKSKAAVAKFNAKSAEERATQQRNKDAAE